MSRLVVTIAGAAIALGFALGCGGGDDETGSAALTKAQFIKQADAICAERTEERSQNIASREKEASKDAEQVDYDTTLKEVVGPSLRREAEEFKALSPPEGNEAKVEQMVESLLGASSAFEDENVKKALQSISQFEDETTEFGFKVCAPET